MALPPTIRPGLTLFAGAMVTGTLGSIHAFSVLLAPLETLLNASRAEVSLLYSVALLSLTIAVLLGHRFYGRLGPPTLAALACLAAALGLVITAQAHSLWMAFLGYGLIFGAANGVGYGFVLQMVAQTLYHRPGFAMGMVTAAYASGAMVFAKVFDQLIQDHGLSVTMLTMSALMVVTSVVVFICLRISNGHYDGDHRLGTPSRVNSRRAWALWGGYGLGAIAGLMAIAHAAAMVAARGGSHWQMVLGAVLIGLGNCGGGVYAGWLVDRWPVTHLLIGLPLLSVIGLSLLIVGESATLTIAGLAIVGTAYGALIAVYPAAVTARFGAMSAAMVYGRVFTAWGLAGLAGPWLAGYLYDQQSNYGLALAVAIVAGLSSATVIYRMDKTAA